MPEIANIPMDEPISGVYTITCKKNGCVYVGQSVHIQYRIRVHISSLCKGNHSNPQLQRDFNKYGIGDFDASVIKLVTGKDALLIEESKTITYHELRGKVYNQSNYRLDFVCKKIPWYLVPCPKIRRPEDRRRWRRYFRGKHPVDELTGCYTYISHRWDGQTPRVAHEIIPTQ